MLGSIVSGDQVLVMARFLEVTFLIFFAVLLFVYFFSLNILQYLQIFVMCSEEQVLVMDRL